MENIRIGTLLNAKNPNLEDCMKTMLPHGFESFSLTFWKNSEGVDMKKLSEQVKEWLDGSDALISCLSVFGNPLETDNDAHLSRCSWEQAIDHAADFGCNLVTGFAGRLYNKPIDASMPRFKEIFGSLAKRAADKGVRIAFENCDMGGTWQSGGWNIAHTPQCWEMMFNEVPDDNLGLQWEPCHQLVKLIDPAPQLRRWLPKIFNVHGKDATIRYDIIKEYGITGSKQFAFHRTPGFGDSNWTDIISELRAGNYQGSIDIEGYHDPVYRREWEMTGQVHALNYLKQCRGGDFIPNPPF